MQRYVALLRAISNVAMQPFRQAMEELGFTDVQSYGMSGNLLFNSPGSNTETLERRIAARLRVPAFVRSRSELRRVMAAYPFVNRPGASILFLARSPAAARRRAFLDLAFEPPRPVLRGKTVSFVHPATMQGKRAPLDFERLLNVQGTARSAAVVSRLLARMSTAALENRRQD
jgi:uncharacterized protein (DUF1697 family)